MLIMANRHVIDLVSSDDDDDADFTPLPSDKKQTHIDEYYLKRPASESATVSNRFAGTFLEPLVRSFRLDSPSGKKFAIQYDEATPYNWIDLVLTFSESGARVPVQIWQTSVNDTLESLTFATFINLAKATTTPAVAHLKALGWGDSAKTVAALDLSILKNMRGKTQEFLRDTMETLATILSELAAAHPEASEKLPAVLIVQCDVGIERSLVLFNLIAYAIAVLHETSLPEITLRQVRFDGTGKTRQIQNELIPNAINSIPDVFERCLKQKTGDSKKKTRYESVLI
jgi:hypothetical protein